MIFLGLMLLALLHLCVQGVVPVNVETVFVIEVTPQLSTDSFVNVMTDFGELSSTLTVVVIFPYRSSINSTILEESDEISPASDAVISRVSPW